ncbi:MAG: inositol monophosphatase family protein [Thermosphaera sp.]
MEEIEELFMLVKKVAGNLSGLLREHYGVSYFSEKIGYGVTGDITRRIDLIAEDYAVEEFRTTGLNVWVVSEEKGLYRLVEEPEYIALIDPLDGSLNFSIGVPLASVSIALFPREGLKSACVPEKMVGIVENIFTGEWYGLAGREVYVNGKPLPSYHYEPSGIASVYFDSVEDLRNLNDVFRNRGWQLKLRVFGSASLESAYASVGKIEYFISLTRKLRNTDIAVGYAIAERLGASISGDAIPSSIFSDSVTTVGRVVISPPNKKLMI